MIKWKHTLRAPRVDVFETDRDAFAAALRASSWFRDEAMENGVEDESSELWLMWDEIKDAENERHFNAVLTALYDYADADKTAWITFEEAEEEVPC